MAPHLLLVSRHMEAEAELSERKAEAEGVPGMGPGSLQ